jgi:MFS transporter, DHA1 family, tetracycline resistance protein
VNKLNKPLPVIFFTLFVNALGFGILIPIIPLLLANPHSEFYLLPPGFTVNQGYIMLGFLTAIFPLMQFFATPILGQLSDKYGRKHLLVFSLFGTFISYLLFAVAIIMRNIPLLFISRGFDGITGGNISVAQAAVADITTPENRVKNFGLIGASFGLGFVLGPYLGGKLSDPTILPFFNAATPFWFAAILSLLNALFVMFFFQETHQHKNIELVINWGKSVMNIVHAYSMKKLRVLFLSFFLFQAGFAFFTTFFSIFLINRFNFTQGHIGDFFSYVGIWMAVTQIFVTRMIGKRFPEYRVLQVSLLGAGVVVLSFFLPTIWWQLLVIVPFFAVFLGLSMANTAALVSRSVDASIQGEVLGINASIQALAQAIPAILSGFIAASVTPESPIMVAAITVLLAGFIFILFYKPVKSVAA